MVAKFICGLQSAPCREIHSFFLLTGFWRAREMCLFAGVAMRRAFG